MRENPLKTGFCGDVDGAPLILRPILTKFSKARQNQNDESIKRQTGMFQSKHFAEICPTCHFT